MKTASEKTIPFNSLSPVSDYEKHKEYCDALEWALKNRKVKDIKNIALTGTYGSGKSSILKTLEERHFESKELHFLKVSLATFKEKSKNKDLISKEENDKSNTKSGKDENKEQEIESVSDNNQLRLIELSILQQIFYQEKHDAIPESRFKKIRSFEPNEVKKATWVLLGLIVTFCGFFYYEEFRKLLYLPSPSLWFRYILQGLFSLGFIVILFLLIKRIIELSHKLTISKFNFQNLEIQIKEDSTKSILNNHLDEILYFFEVTSYNVVIIEDLDRFEQTEIFTKLREINLLLNNSKAINREIVFIYAIRDEMFKDAERTKFFDFIIPVIPVINYSNSKEQLTKALDAFGYKISSDLIKDIAFYIDDMRLLYNIVNEFHLYFQKLKGKEYINKLFAIIFYKNIYPEDFVLLSKKEGMLYKYIIEKKDKWIENRTVEIEKEIESKKEKIKQIDLVFPKTIDQLKRIYMIEIINQLKDFRSFLINGNDVTINKMLEDSNFESLINNQANYRYGDYSSYQKNASINFQDIEKTIDSSQGYEIKKELIKKQNSNEKDNLRQEVKELDEERIYLRTAKIQDLLTSGNIKTSKETIDQEKIILFLLRNGYIAEDYLAYISYFYPGSLTEADHWFLMNVKNETGNEYDYKLSKISNLIKEINVFDFSKKSVLNYNLVDFLLESKSFKPKREMLFKQLVNESESTIGFIDGFIENGGQIEKFIKSLSKYWNGIWKYIGENIFVDEEKRNSYLKLIIDYAEIESIVEIAKNSNLKSFIAQKKDFLSIITSENKIKEVIKNLEVEFEELEFDGVSEEIKEFIYRHNYYALTPEMLALMTKYKGVFNKTEFDTANYTFIAQSGLENLIARVEENIQDYILNVYLKIETNKNNEETDLVRLLNNEINDLTLKEKIIDSSNVKVLSINEIDNIDIRDLLLINEKVVTNWENVFDYFETETEEEIQEEEEEEEEEMDFNRVLINFLNNETNYKELSKQKLNDSDRDEDFIKSFSKLLLTCEDIDISAYTSLINSIPYVYPKLNISGLSNDKIDILLSNKKLVLNPFHFNNLKLKEKDLHIRLIEVKQDSLLKMSPNLELEDNDYLKILKSSEIKVSIKIDFIKNIEDNLIAENSMIAKEIGLLLPSDKKIELPFKVLTAIFSTNIPILKMITLLNFNISYLEDYEIESLIVSLGGKYKDVFKKQHRPSFQYNTQLDELFDNLKERDLIIRYEVDKKKSKVKVIAKH